MQYLVHAWLLFWASSGVYDTTVSEECLSFVDGLDKQSAAYRIDYDITYKSGLRELGATLDKWTDIRFGNQSLRMPFIGEDKIVVDFGVGSHRMKHDSGRMVASLYFTARYKSVEDYLTRRPVTHETPSDGTVLHEWLVFKGFEYTTKDLDCTRPEAEIADTLAFLIAKAPMSGEGSTVYRLEQFDIGLIRVQWTLGIVMVLDEDRMFYLTFEAKDPNLIEQWVRQ